MTFLAAAAHAYRAHRIINININILLASTLSTLLAAYPVYWMSTLLDSYRGIVVFSFAVDSVMDAFLFSALHLLVHRAHLLNKPARYRLYKDLFTIHQHRGILSVVFFAMATSAHYFLMEPGGLAATPSFILAYLSSLLVTRTLHTLYGIRTGLFTPRRKK